MRFKRLGKEVKLKTLLFIHYTMCFYFTIDLNTKTVLYIISNTKEKRLSAQVSENEN